MCGCMQLIDVEVSLQVIHWAWNWILNAVIEIENDSFWSSISLPLRFSVEFQFWNIEIVMKKKFQTSAALPHRWAEVVTHGQKPLLYHDQIKSMNVRTRKSFDSNLKPTFDFDFIYSSVSGFSGYLPMFKVQAWYKQPKGCPFIVWNK